MKIEPVQERRERRRREADAINSMRSDLFVGKSWGDENLKLPKSCKKCKREVRVDIRGEMPVGARSKYVSASATCECGWQWSHDSVFQTELS